MPVISYEKIIPPDYVAELINLGQTVSENAWRVGDIANECILLNQLAENDVTKQDVYRAVGKFWGRASRTVRYYAEVAAFYSVLTRKKYEALSFDHFRFAMKYTNWQEILDYAMSNFDNSGLPATVDHLVAVFAMEEREVKTDNEILELVESLKKAVYKVPMSGDVRRLVIDALQRITEAFSMVEVH